MSQQELLKKVIKTLEDIGIEYMLTGSIVSSLQGEPRSTHDIDIVIDIQKSAVNIFVESFPSNDFCLDKDSMLDGIDAQDMFNLYDIGKEDRVDFWILKDQPYDQSRFSRKYTEEFSGIKMQVSSPEDTILSKLKWAKVLSVNGKKPNSISEKHFTDALRIYEVQFEKLDDDYLEFWGKELSIVPLLERLKNEAEVV